MRAQEPPARGGASPRRCRRSPPSPTSPAADWRGPQHQQHLPTSGGLRDSGSLSLRDPGLPAGDTSDFPCEQPCPRPPALASPSLGSSQQSGGPGSLESQVSSGGAREAGVATPGSRGTISAPEAQRSPHPSRQDASYLVPREERVFVQDGPAGLGGRRHCGALHAALPESEQPLRLLRGSGRLLSLHELSRGGGR